MSTVADDARLPDAEAPPLRFVTAASLFDGHDAAINIMRRLLQGLGAEVIHLGHDRGVEELVEAAVEEDADAVALSSYQGGHMEYFEYLVQRLAERTDLELVVDAGLLSRGRDAARLRGGREAPRGRRAAHR